MLDPDSRQLYVEALRPPSNYVLADAIATTYSLDLTTLLGFPIAFALPNLDVRRLGQASAVALLEALRRASSRMTVFCERGLIGAPSEPHVLYGSLEPAIVEVQAPAGGCLHAKTWLMRFEPDDGVEGDPLMRLLVLSRNLTNDRCWDVSLVLDGRLTGRNRSANRPLADLYEAVLSYAVREPTEALRKRVESLCVDARRTEWELPAGFDEIAFHTLGLKAKGSKWLPPPSDRLVVVSPFVRDEALTALVETTNEPVALVSRGEELDRVPAATLARFNKTYVLHDRAEAEDGEDLELDATRRVALCGLHAKVYVAKRGWNTHLYLGSANASNAALLAGANIEFLAELIGKSSKLQGKGIDGLFDPEGLGAILVEYQPTTRAAMDPSAEAAERALRGAAIELASAQLTVHFERAGADHAPTLRSPTPLALTGIELAKAWLVTTDPATATDVLGLRQGQHVSLTTCATASATGLVAFELRAAVADVRSAFTLNLAVHAMPTDRDAQVVRVILANKEGFFAYLLALLEGLDTDLLGALDSQLRGNAFGPTASVLTNGLLERLVRARARDPKRLDELRHVVDSLRSTPEGTAIIPPSFIELWNAIAPEDTP